jgi:hypothetical protein
MKKILATLSVSVTLVASANAMQTEIEANQTQQKRAQIILGLANFSIKKRNKDITEMARGSLDSYIYNDWNEFFKEKPSDLEIVKDLQNTFTSEDAKYDGFFRNNFNVECNLLLKTSIISSKLSETGRLPVVPLINQSSPSPVKKSETDRLIDRSSVSNSQSPNVMHSSTSSVSSIKSNDTNDTISLKSWNNTDVSTDKNTDSVCSKMKPTRKEPPHKKPWKDYGKPGWRENYAKTKSSQTDGLSPNSKMNSPSMTLEEAMKEELVLRILLKHMSSTSKKYHETQKKYDDITNILLEF